MSSKNRKKRPRNPTARESADDAKRPRLPAQPDTFHNTPTWSFALCDINGPFGWDTASRDDLLRVVEHLRQLEKLKLSEILGERRRGNHQPRPDQLGKAAQDRLKELGLDPDRLISLHLDGGGRIWLIRNGSALSLLWWDPHHLVWPRPAR